MGNQLNPPLMSRIKNFMCQGDGKTDLTRELEAAEMSQGSLASRPLQNSQPRHNSTWGLKEKLVRPGGLST